MTVQEVINILNKVEDKSVPIFIDCNYCGKGLEFKTLDKVYLIRSSILHPQR
jgi:hypothetical protein